MFSGDWRSFIAEYEPWQKAIAPGIGLRPDRVLINPDIDGDITGIEADSPMQFSDSVGATYNGHGEISAIDGFIKNDKSLFKYKFSDTHNLYDLTFTGSWIGNVNAEGEIPLKFEFEREDKSRDNFSFPAKARFDRTINQFVYEFEKENGTERTSIRLVGHVAIGKDSSITYSFESQKEDGTERVRASRFSIAAEMKTEKFEGALAVTYSIKNKNGVTTDKTLSIGGKFTFLKGKAPFQLMFVFEMKKSATDKAVSSQIMFSGQLLITNVGKVQWKFEQTANVKKLEIEVTDVQFKKFKVDSKFNLISENGTQKKTVRFILGVSF